MTHFIYMLWFIALLALAWEADRRWGGWVRDRFLPELSGQHPWFWPPVLSLAVPGSGQWLNGQPAKGLLCFLWPFLLVALHRPGSTEPLTLWLLIGAWYVLVVADALVSSLARARTRRSRLHRKAKPTLSDD